MAETYYDSLIDCALMIGVDELSGLNLSKVPGAGCYQQHILAAISSTVAMFPFRKEKQSQYPPEEFKSGQKLENVKTERPTFSKQRSQDEFQLINDLVSQYNKTENRGTESAVNLSKRYSKIMSSRRKSIKTISLDNYKGSLGSVSIETIKAFPGTYFNNNLKISSSYVEPIVEILPMTDNLGNRSYAFRLEFYRMFTIKFGSDDKETSQNIEPVYETDLDSSDSIFLPCNIVLFSKFPYFSLCKDILSQLFQSIKNKSTEFIQEQIMEYTSILTRIPIMKSGNIQINFTIDTSRYLVRPNNPMFDQIVDWDMSYLFHVLSLENIILILCAMFQDHKIAFFSNHTNIITIICESLMVLFQPFSWKHFYLPIVPSHLVYDLTDAIFPFMMGLPCNLKDRVSTSYNDILIVDLDEGTVTIPKKFEIVNISKSLITRMKTSLKNRDWLTFRDDFPRINTTSWDEYKEFSYRTQKKINDKVMQEFMIMMVDLFHEVLFNISVEKQNDSTLVVSSNKFFATSHSENIEFFRAIYLSDNFNCFLNSKLKTTSSDSWDKFCQQIYPDLLDHYRLQTFKINKIIRKPVFQILERDENIKSIDGEPFQVLDLPTSRTERKDYYKSVLRRIGQLIPGMNARRLEIEIYLQMTNRAKALDLIHQALLVDKEALDLSKIRNLVKGIRKNPMFDFERLDFSTSLSKILRMDDESYIFQEKRNSIVQHFSPPNIPIPKNRFYEICKNGNITEFESIADDLFKCLTLDQKKNMKALVPPEYFRNFYDNWIQCSYQLHGSDININELLDEILMIKTDSWVKVDGYGQGQILLTHLRLLFIPFGKTYIRPIIDFSSETVTKIKVDRRLRGFGKLCEVLEITKTNSSKKVSIWLPDEIDVWYNLISEISFRNRLSNEEKDKVIQDKMIDQCLVYENLMKCSKQISYFKKNTLVISEIMLTMSNLNQKGLQTDSPVHRKYLICKLMPFPKQTVTIDYAIVIEMPILKNFDIWCAVNVEEKVYLKIFNIINETLHELKSVDIDISARVKFMIDVNKLNKILISCINGAIYVISTVNFKFEEFNIKGNEGIYPICGTVRYETSNYFTTFLGTNDGEIIKCDGSFNKISKIVMISENATANFIDFYDNATLVIGTAHEIIFCSTTGEIISTIRTFHVTTIFNRISFMGLENHKRTLILGLARLPVLIEYDLTNVKDPICLRLKNLSTGKDYTPNDFSGNSESTSKYVGISYALIIPTNDTSQQHAWIIYKDGRIDIFNYQTLEKLDAFCAHNGIVSGSMISDIGNKKIAITLGKDDGKVILWNPNPCGNSATL